MSYTVNHSSVLSRATFQALGREGEDPRLRADEVRAEGEGILTERREDLKGVLKGMSITVCCLLVEKSCILRTRA